MPQQAVIDFFGDARRQRLAARHVLADTRWQGGGRGQQVAMTAQRDADLADVHRGSMQAEVLLLRRLMACHRLALVTGALVVRLGGAGRGTQGQRQRAGQRDHSLR